MKVVAGHILAMRLFDVAYAIDLGRAQTLLARHAAGQPVRSRLSATPAKAVAFDVPPLNVTLDLVVLDLDGYRVPTVSAAVHRKLAIIRDTYTALYDEASAARSEIMEAAIVLLIVTELVLALVRH